MSQGCIKGNETQTSIPTEPKDRQEWKQIGLSWEDQRGPSH